MDLGQQELLARTTELHFTVIGEAKPGGSKKGFADPRSGRVVVVEDSKNKPWKRAVASAGAEAREVARDAWPGLSHAPLAVAFTFYRPRPRSHYGTGRNALIVKAHAPAHPTTRPDVLKLARAAEDALTGVLWHDDSQIVHETLSKLWGEPERLEITVREL
jgi:Holliday junction resolvase RusA-like endonuclease